MGSDPSGAGWLRDAWNWVREKVDVIVNTGIILVKNIAEDVSDFRWDNEDEERVLESNYISAYKEHLVVRLPIGKNAFSFGALFIGKNNNDINTVRHEYGHAIHFDQIGLVNYSLFVGMPSLLGFWSDVGYDVYYSQPWEYIADSLGGVKRMINKDIPYEYLPNSKELADAWWRLSKRSIFIMSGAL